LLPNAFELSPDRLMFKHGSVAMSLQCFLAISTETPLTRLGYALTKPLRVKSRLQGISSIGAALIPDNGISPEEIIHSADLAMHRAKSQDKSSLVFFEPDVSQPRQIA
jgi:GGDEF domain-containing protein